MLRHSAKDLWIKALILFMVLEDDVGYERALEGYLDQEPSFSNNFELKLLKKLNDRWMAKDSDGFSQVAYDWEQKSNLDKWKRNLLSKVKRNIEKKNPPKKKKNEDSDDDGGDGGNDQGQDDDSYDPY
mgnify:CR=1 FL=1